MQSDMERCAHQLTPRPGAALLNRGPPCVDVWHLKVRMPSAIWEGSASNVSIRAAPIWIPAIRRAIQPRSSDTHRGPLPDFPARSPLPGMCGWYRRRRRRSDPAHHDRQPTEGRRGPHREDHQANGELQIGTEGLLPIRALAEQVVLPECAATSDRIRQLQAGQQDQ